MKQEDYPYHTVTYLLDSNKKCSDLSANFGETEVTYKSFKRFHSEKRRRLEG